MIINKTKFKDLLVIKQKNNLDSRGNLRETFNFKIVKKNLFLNTALHLKVMFLEGFTFKRKKNKPNM